MSSNQVEIRFMILKLKEWNEQIGGSQSKRTLASSEFDFLREEFLSKRHAVEKCQDLKQREGITTVNPNVGYEIRQGLSSMRELLAKLKEEHRRLTKKKKDSPEILERKLKIVENCQLLLKDLEERQNGDAPKNKYKVTTLTDMKAKLLSEIDLNNQIIHEDGSDGHLSVLDEEQGKQIKKWKQKDLEMDVMVDEIITGVQGIRKKVKQIDEHQDVINQKTKKADTKISKVSERIQKDNDGLKKIIKQFKKSRCCLFISLFLLTAGLIVCIVKLLI